MDLRLIRLENRILFDAAVAAAIVTAVDNGDSGDTGDTGDISQPADLGENLADIQDNPTADDAQTDEGAEDTHVLVVSTNVDDYQALSSSAAADVIVVEYNPDTTSLDGLYEKIEAALDGQTVDTLAFATHGQNGAFYLTDGYWVTETRLADQVSLQNFWRNIGTLMEDGGRVDLLGCNIGANDFGLIEALDNILDVDGKSVDLAASLDMTGNNAGENWALEVGQVDALMYFDAASLGDWSGSLASFVVTDPDINDSGGFFDILNQAATNGIDGDVIKFDPGLTTIAVNQSVVINHEVIIDGLSGRSDPIELVGSVFILRSGSEGSVFTGLSITNAFFGFDVDLGNRNAVNPDPITIRDNTISDAPLVGGTAGILVRGSQSVLLLGNQIFSVDDGIFIVNSDDITVQGNILSNNIFSGIRIRGGSDIVIGGETTLGVSPLQEGNLIGNNVVGISIQTPSASFIASDIQISGNFIGVDVDGVTPLGNVRGIEIVSSIPNTNFETFQSEIIIGGGGYSEVENFVDSRANVISNNTEAGIIVSNYAGVVIQGNIIGPTGAGDSAVVDSQDIGIIVKSREILIQDNLISGNSTDGILFPNEGVAEGAVISGNRIGTDVTGQFALGNGGDGIFIENSDDIIIVGDFPLSLSTPLSTLNIGEGVANVQGTDFTFTLRKDTLPMMGSPIIETSIFDIDIDGFSTVQDLIAGISDATGGEITASINATKDGFDLNYPVAGAPGPFAFTRLMIDTVEPDSTVADLFGFDFAQSQNSGLLEGQSVFKRGNLISGNGGSGIHLLNVSNTQIIGNFIGTDIDGDTALGNDGNGIHIEGSQRVMIGNPDSTIGNLISGNGLDGILVEASVVELVLSTPLSSLNDGNGVRLTAAQELILQLEEPEGILVPVRVDLEGVITVQDLFDLIETESNGKMSFSINSELNGFNINFPADNILSGLGTGVEDLFGVSQISFVTSGLFEGLPFTVAPVETGNISIQGNKIGTDITGELALNNGENGIHVEGSENVVIGDGDISLGNLISGNGTNGIFVESTGIESDTLVSSLNDGNGIQLTGDADPELTFELVGFPTGPALFFPIDLENVDTVGDLLSKIQADSFDTVTFSINSDRNGFDLNFASGFSLDGMGTGILDLLGENQLVNLIDTFEGSPVFNIAISEDVSIIGNKIGTDITGTTPLGNQQDGIFIQDNDDVYIGGDVSVSDILTLDTPLSFLNAGRGVADVSGIDFTIRFIDVPFSGPDVTVDVDIDVAGLTTIQDLFDEIAAVSSSVGIPFNMTPVINLSKDGIDLTFNTSIPPHVLVVSSSTSTQTVVDLFGFEGTGETDGRIEGLPIAPFVSSDAVGNLISGNIGSGIHLDGSDNTVIERNIIGANVDGLFELGNQNHGIEISNSDGTIIGGAVTQSGFANLISGNTYDGIHIQDGSNTTIQGNLIGTDKTGNAILPDMLGPVGNGGNGVSVNVTAISDVSLGVIEGNVIGGNGEGIGIFLENQNLTLSLFSNRIGIGLDGDTAIGNRSDGIAISDNTYLNNTVITVGDVGKGNVISANDAHGIRIDADNEVNIFSNLIGTDNTGMLDRGNVENGIYIDDTQGLIRIGSASAWNVISGNDENGIAAAAFGDEAGTVIIQGNRIGTDRTGRSPIGNTENGIFFAVDINAQIGGVGLGSDLNEGNLISGNGGEGIYAFRAVRGQIQGNRIGTDIDGATAISNQMNGIKVEESRGINISPPGNFLGDPDSLRNLISGNMLSGIHFLNSESSSVHGNYIGTDRGGSGSLANNRNGVLVEGSSSITVGGRIIPATEIAQLGNLISGNAMDGVALINSSDITIQHNKIGTNDFSESDPAAAYAIANGSDGVYLSNSTNNLIGAPMNTGLSNFISGNMSAGVFLDNNSRNNDVIGNFIGTVDGITALPNNSDGVRIKNSSENTIGGVVEVLRDQVSFDLLNGNLISGNRDSGILLEQADSNEIYGNFIGTDLSGTKALPNSSGGIVLFGSNNIIGGDLPENRRVNDLTNIISFNNFDGISIFNQAGALSNNNVIQDNIISMNEGNGIGVIENPGALKSFGNSFLRNSIFGNGGLGIDLSNDGPTLNDIDDLDVGPNTLINFPEILSAMFTGGSLQFLVSVDGPPMTTFNIDFYVNFTGDPSGFGEGQQHIGSATVETNSTVQQFVSISRSGILPGARLATAIITGPSGNSSEFSSNELISEASPPQYYERIQFPPLPSGIARPGVTPLAYGYLNFEGINQLSSFGERLGFDQLAKFGDHKSFYLTTDGEPQLMNAENRDTGFGRAVDALNYAYELVGLPSDSAETNEEIEDLSGVDGKPLDVSSLTRRGAALGLFGSIQSLLNWF